MIVDKELCYVMIKPGFVNKEIINNTKKALENKGMRVINESRIKYDEECARLHYIEKQIKPYFKELVDYLVSDYAYGMILEGRDAVTVCRNTVEELRTTLKEKYNLNTDVMRNILHCSSRTKVGNQMLELDTQRELALFCYLEDKKSC